jgi:hypothetical protein
MALEMAAFKPDWDEIFNHYDAVVDWPRVVFWEEFLHKDP